MLSSLFDPTASGWRNFSRIMDLFGLSLCWLVCSLPLFTLGASTTALYDAVYHGVRREENRVYGRFFSTFRTEFKTALLVTLPALALWVLYRLLFRLAFAVAVGGSDAAGVLVYAYRLLFCVPLAVWLFAMAALSRFTFGPAALVKTALQLVFLRLPSAAAVTALVLAACRLAAWWPISAIFLPALTALGASFFLERVFAPFLKQTPDSGESPEE